MNIAEQKRQEVQRTYRAHVRALDDYLKFIDTRGSTTQASRRPKIAVIQETVADHFQQHISCMTTKDRPAAFVEARCTAIAICRALTKYSQAEIGECFGGRDHGTISNAVTHINNWIQTETDFKKQYEALLETCRQELDNIDLPIFAKTRVRP
jgi:chromosomal replication initiation ATPase DnaA